MTDAPVSSDGGGEVAPAPLAGVHHLALLVTDLAASERFYSGSLQLRVVRRWPTADGAGERAVWLELGGGAILALEAIAAERVPSGGAGEGPGFHLLALRIERSERAAWARRLAAAGHPVYKRTPYTIYTRDPEGNRLGLSHFPEPAEDDADVDV